MLFLRETFLKRPPLSKRTPLSTKPPIYEQFFHGPSLSKFQKRDTPITLGWGNYADISTAFGRVWHAGLLHKLQSYGISGQIFCLISSFLSNRRLWMVLDGKSLHEYPVNAGVPQGYILSPTLFLLYINDLPDDILCDIAIYADDTTLYSKSTFTWDPKWTQTALKSRSVYMAIYIEISLWHLSKQ